MIKNRLTERWDGFLLSKNALVREHLGSLVQRELSQSD